MNFKEINEFSREFKKLLKKYKTLKQDLDNFKKSVLAVDFLKNKNFDDIYSDERMKIIKARFFCRYLRGKTLRIIYSLCEEKEEIEFVEIYFKGNKANEDRERIKQYIESNR